MSEKSDRKPESVVMSITLEMKHSIVRLAGPRQEADTRESMIARAARRAGIHFRQAKAFYYGEARDPRISSVEKVRAALRETQREQEAKARDELTQLRARLSRLEAALSATDPDFHSVSIDLVRQQAGELSRMDRALVDGGER